MSEFKVIETQEELNSIIGERLKRNEAKYAEESADLRKEIDALKASNEELNAKLIESNQKNATSDSTISALNDRIKKYETDSVKTRIAREVGIPSELIDRLRGESEEDLRKDAESLKALLPGREAPAKGNAPKPGNEDESRAGLREMIAQFKN